MQKRFTAQVPSDLAMEYGWFKPMTYAEMFDILSNAGMLISISRYYDFGKECFGDGYDWCIDCENTLRGGATGDADTWIEAANQALRAYLDLKVE